MAHLGPHSAKWHSQDWNPGNRRATPSLIYPHCYYTSGVSSQLSIAPRSQVLLAPSRASSDFLVTPAAHKADSRHQWNELASISLN